MKTQEALAKMHRYFAVRGDGDEMLQALARVELALEQAWTDGAALIGAILDREDGAPDAEMRARLLVKENHPGAEMLAELQRLRAQAGRIHTAVGVREGEALESAVLRLVEDAKPEGRWEKRARALYAWLVAHVPVKAGDRWQADNGREYVVEKVEPGMYAFRAAAGTSSFMSTDHPASLGWAPLPPLEVLLAGGKDVDPAKVEALKSSPYFRHILMAADEAEALLPASGDDAPTK